MHITSSINTDIKLNSENGMGMIVLLKSKSVLKGGLNGR